VLAHLAAGGCIAKLCSCCMDTPSSGWRSPCVCRCPAVERRRLGQSDARGWAPAGPVVVFRAATDLFHARQGLPAKASPPRHREAIQAQRLYPAPGSAAV
jgi:hypothetical protein